MKRRSTTTSDERVATWRPPTRRTFVAMLGAAAAAFAVREHTPAVEPEQPRSTWAGKTRWIGHC
jgi:hypothetical protein